MFQEIAKTLMDKEPLSPMQANLCINLMMENKISDIQKASLLSLIQAKGVTPDELAAFAATMREHSIKLENVCGEPLLDTCGTGGDGLGTFNISTASAFVAAACGVKVAKHGNRAASSKCGSADLLEGLGVKIDIDPEVIKTCIRETGFGFMFAKNHHPAMGHMGVVRKELGFRTIFNLLGPLCNPASTEIQVMGVFSPQWVPVIADVLKSLGTTRALIVHGSGMDEFSPCSETLVNELQEGAIKSYTVVPEDFGLKSCRLEDIKGGDVKENTKIVQNILEGHQGPKTDAVVLNAAASIYAYGISDSIKEGVTKAQEALAKGSAKKTLEKLVEITSAS